MNSGIYIHIPFCESKCGYCDFYSITDSKYQKDFLLCLEKEINIYANQYNNKNNFDTIYIGGGTPSVLPSEQISHIINLLKKNFKITNDVEITVEINPGTVNKSKLQEIKNAGVNRLSIGVQSFNAVELKFLERIHDVNESLESVKLAKEVGFNNLSIDLIYALPGQTIKNWKSSLDKAIKLNPEHISAYNLTIEKNTPFGDLKNQGILKPLSELKENEFFDYTDSILSKAGYNHYEISNFAKKEKYISKHNYKYWQHNYYLGFGPSAHSFWENQRWGNVRSIEKYILLLIKNEKPLDFCESLSVKNLEFEHIFLSLRTYIGVDLKAFENKFQLNFKAKYKSTISPLLKAQYAEFSDTSFRLTRKGMMLCDEILPAFSTN
jgi:oxygen-independent coproporphyrinogen III oxidase